MKKKVFILLIFLVSSASLLFAGGNGNGGKDKIGGYVGWPIGLSYSHEFNNLVELDLLVGFNGYHPGWGGLTAHIGALFTVAKPVIDTQECPFTIGIAGGLSGSFWGGRTAELSLFVPLRWEINLKDIKAFNIFLEYAPGLAIYVHNSPGNIIRYDPRAGIGLRYRIPD